MSIFTEVESALAKAGKFMLNLGANLTSIFAKEAKLLPADAAALLTVVQDVETLIPLLSTSVATEGLNFPADSAAYAALLKLKTDALALAGQLETSVKAL